MALIKRILIGSDPLMTKESEQVSNNRWLFDLLRRPIQRATGVTPELFHSSLKDDGSVDRKAFFKASGIQLDLNDTQYWFDADEVSQESIDYLSQFVSPRDLVVGYELSEQTRSVLTRMGVHYVDIWLHPVRFMDDVLFGFNSNNGDIRCRLFEYDIPEDQMFLHADKVRIQTYKGWRRVEADVQENSALFVGQMLNDKSVCLNGKMLNILDFKERVEEIAAEHSRIYYARHPYLRSGDEEIMRFIKAHPAIELTDIPSYRMLASPHVSRVFGVSSSVIQEARYFDKASEYLFRPIFTYGQKKDPASYATIYQEFISPHFWSDILRLTMRTIPCPKIMFDNPKDKLRDMLGFYWAYPDIDKVENMRRTLSAVNNNAQRTNHSKAKAVASAPAKSQPAPTPAGFYQNNGQLSQIEQRFSDQQIISFDIFDTLIERIVDKPGDIHPMMSIGALSITNGKIADFGKARREARDQALDKANGEEVLLKDRYQAMAKAYGLSPEVGEELHQYELELERRICRPRYAGVRLLNRALKEGKRVILVSDIFFDRAFVEELLKNAGIEGWHRLYLSSEEGVLKHTGRLFDVVLKKEGVPANRILHIGDNKVADVEKGESRGLNTAHLTEKRLIADRASGSIKAFEKISDPSVRSIVRGLVSREITSTTLPSLPGNANQSPEFLGYGIAGPFFWGFAKWILEQARKEGVTDLYFLARDGEIVKKCYEAITRDAPHDAPRAHYLLASRRAVNVARLQTADDIAGILETSFTPCSLERLLQNRFGVDANNIAPAVFQDNGYFSAEDTANIRTETEKLKTFFKDPRVVEEILASAAAERDLLIENYRAEGLGEEGQKIAFVDIGHSGSLQAAISEIMDLSNTVGLYFATKEDIDEKVGRGHKTMGYVVDRMAHANRSHPYQRHILMFELLFQNQQGSFLCYNDGPEGVQPTFLNLSGEADRVAFIRQVHDGAERFAEDMTQVENDLELDFRIAGAEAIVAYLEMLTKPTTEDANIFLNVGFENKYSSRDMQWIVPKTPSGAPAAIWKEGASVVFPDLPAPVVTGGGIGLSLLSLFILNGRKRAKLKRDPDAFFADSRKPVIRAIGQFV